MFAAARTALASSRPTALRASKSTASEACSVRFSAAVPKKQALKSEQALRAGYMRRLQLDVQLASKRSITTSAVDKRALLKEVQKKFEPAQYRF